MKVKELIAILSSVDPMEEVCLQIGLTLDDEYRKQCAKAELIEGECLNMLTIDRVELVKTSVNESVWPNIILKQDNYGDLDDMEKRFDLEYQKKDVG